MSISEMQSGIDDSPGGLSDQFENERIKLTKKGEIFEGYCLFMSQLIDAYLYDTKCALASR